jgi:ribonuclease D
VIADVDHLRALVRTGAVFLYRERRETWMANAIEFQFVKTRKSTQRTGWQGTFLITIRSIQ